MRLPKSWNEVTVRQWYELRKITTSDPIDNIVQTVAVLSGKSPDEIEDRYSIEKLKAAIPQLGFMKHLPSTIIPQLVIVNRRFYRINTDIHTMVPAQYVDLTTLTKDQKTIDESLHKIMAVVTLPVKWYSIRKTVSYRSDPFNKRAEAFLDLPMSTVYPVAVFFCNLLEAFMEPTKDYLKKVEKQMMTQPL